MTCEIHPGQEIKGVCVNCKTQICDLCEFEIQGKSYCKKCATALMEDIEAKLKLDIPEVVKCEICGKPRYSGQQFYLCGNCGVVTCPEHWYEELKLCEKCYDKTVEEEIFNLKNEGLIRTCPNCGTENKLTAEKCRNRNCKAALPKLKNAEEIRKRNVPCAKHPEKPAYVQCASCGKYLCLDCENTHKHEHYCSDCLNEIKTKEAVIRKKRLKIGAIVTVIIAGVLGLSITACLITGAISTHRKNVASYESAITDYESGNYDVAIEKLSALGDFKESEKKLEEVRNAAYEKELGFAKKAEENGELETALSHYEKADNYGESKKDIARVTVLIGRKHFESKEYEKALEYFEKAHGIDKLVGEDLNNLRYCNAWVKNENGVVGLREAKEILNSFKYAKATKDTSEYEKIRMASLKADDSVKNFEEAYELYAEFPGLKTRLDASKKKRDSINKTIAKLETDRAAEAEREARRAAAEAEKEARKLAGTIRKDYLDEGLDIRVSVYGPENTKIKLTYVLFSRVWAHEFAKGDIMTEMQNLGFKKVTLSDGYSEYWYWNLD
jgi:tetratricopeptide (TPR) repeat protein